MNQKPITNTGYILLKEELKLLKHDKRPAISKEIAAARSLGDLAENAEYHAAREKQSFVEAKIRELEDLIATSVVVDITHIDQSKIAFGALITLLDVNTNNKLNYSIVSEYESNVAQRKISFSSPLAKALIGKRNGEDITVELPNGLVKEYIILDIQYK